MRVAIKGVHTTIKKLKNGERKRYYYSWRKGPRIEAEPGTPEFIAAYMAACQSRTRIQADTVAGLIREFENSSQFPQSESSRRAYRNYLNLIDMEFGDMPLAALANRKARARFMRWRDTMQDTPRKADYAWSVLARLFAFGKNRSLIQINPCERGGRLYRARRTEKIWTAADIASFCQHASAELCDALVLALWTGQRQGDVLKLTWSAFDGETLRLRQRKTGAYVAIPVKGALKTLLERRKEARGQSVTILTNTYGQPWTSNGFRASWAKAFKRAKLRDLHFHDLRGTAVTRLAIAGCTNPEIASVTGHSLTDVAAILDAHYLGGRIELAENAIEKMTAKYG